MNGESIAAFLKTQAGAAASAPIPFLAAVAVAALVIWRVFDYRYGAEIANLKEDVKSRDRKLSEAQAKISELSVLRAPAKEVEPTTKSESATKPKAEAQQEANRRRRAIDTMDQAIYDASTIRRDFDREREKVLPVIRAAALSVSKAFEIATVPRITDIVVELELNRRYWERVRPFLVENHLTEAREAADEFMSKFSALRAAKDAARATDLLS